MIQTACFSWKTICLLLVVAAVPAVAAMLYGQTTGTWDLRRNEVGEVSDNWIRLRLNKVLWVDARSELLFKKDAISGAIRLNEGEWERNVPNLLDKWKPGILVVVYCDRHCSSSQRVARRIRRELGIDEVFVLQGGREAWPSQ